jgi:hypothetical protein
MAAVELRLVFTDTYVEGESEPLEFTHTISAPEGMEITGGQIFVENPNTGDFQRFAFRVDRDEDGKADLNILEDVKS